MGENTKRFFYERQNILIIKQSAGVQTFVWQSSKLTFGLRSPN